MIRLYKVAWCEASYALAAKELLESDSLDNNPTGDSLGFNVVLARTVDEAIKTTSESFDIDRDDHICVYGARMVCRDIRIDPDADSLLICDKPGFEDHGLISDYSSRKSLAIAVRPQ